MGTEAVIKTWLAKFLRRRERGTTEALEARPDRAAAIGALGEALVAGYLREMGWPALRNVVLREQQRSTEIDILARAPSAIVVLEVKAWSGFIQGAAQAASWTRHGQGERQLSVPNAVRQNLAHVGTVERAIGDRGVRVWGLVVSAGHARFAPALRPHVVPLTSLSSVLLTHAAEMRERAQDALDCAWAKLACEAQMSQARRVEHMTWLRARDRARGKCE
jgi:hypothetical protein